MGDIALELECEKVAEEAARRGWSVTLQRLLSDAHRAAPSFWRRSVARWPKDD